jgi:hypothetical protein
MIDAAWQMDNENWTNAAAVAGEIPSLAIRHPTSSMRH